MSKFHFWATIISAFVLGIVGLVVGGSITLPGVSPGQTKGIFAVSGVLLALVTFSKVAAWFVRTFSRLVRILARRLATEIINQFTTLASRGWTALPVPGRGEEAAGRQSLERDLGGAVILDTSSIIDGRILDVGRSGFLSGLVLVPNFVLTELQQVADSSDSLKRLRGRRGFEIVEELKKINGLKLEIWDKEVAGRNVDDKLLRIGKIIRGKILTCDFNLNRVATVSGVKVLNLNVLANALKALPVPGERFKIKIIHQGKDKTQGVGYLADGTMVVVKEASLSVGEEVSLEVGKILQGPAGRMIFGKLQR